MDDLMNDLEAGLGYNLARQTTKKMKKRKQLDALLKSRLLRSNRSSHPAVHSSEDELLPSDRKPSSSTHSSSAQYRRRCSYTRHILSFCLVCVFMIVCVGLAYANIELKNEVQNLSSRVTEIEKRFSNSEINRVISSIELIKSRLNLIERWNVSYIYERLQKLQTDFNQMRRNALSAETTMQHEDVDISSKLNTMEEKSTHFSEVADELEKLSQDADSQVIDAVTEKIKPFNRTLIEHLLEQERRDNVAHDTAQLAKSIVLLNESFYTNAVRWREELKSVRTDMNVLNQTSRIQELLLHFQELENFMQNTTEKTSALTAALQSSLEKLRVQIEACQCSKELRPVKPAIVDGGHMQQVEIVRTNAMDEPSSSSTASPTSVISDHDLPKDTARDGTLDIAQIVNSPADRS